MGEEAELDPKQEAAKEVIQRMWASLKELGSEHDLKKARSHLKGTVDLYKEGKYFEIPNREAVFEVILNVAREKHQRNAILEKVRVARDDLQLLEEKGQDIGMAKDLFDFIKELIRDKDYEVARIKFLELELQLTLGKKALGIDVGANPLSDPKIKRVIISDGESKPKGPELEWEDDDEDVPPPPSDEEEGRQETDALEGELVELEVLEEYELDEDEDEPAPKKEPGDEEQDDGLEWED